MMINGDEVDEGEVTCMQGGWGGSSSVTRDKQTIRSSDSSAPCSGPYVHDLDANSGTLIGTLLVGVRGGRGELGCRI